MSSRVDSPVITLPDFRRNAVRTERQVREHSGGDDHLVVLVVRQMAPAVTNKPFRVARLREPDGSGRTGTVVAAMERGDADVIPDTSGRRR
jgi:hypothetical protein